MVTDRQIRKCDSPRLADRPVGGRRTKCFDIFALIFSAIAEMLTDSQPLTTELREKHAAQAGVARDRP